MQVVILAGGEGSRLGEETLLRPKPMIEIGGMPILWHIMKLYSAHGFNRFILLLGYKGDVIKDFFTHYYRYRNDMTINLRENSIRYHTGDTEPWEVTLVDTGRETHTGGRIKRAMPYLQGDHFLLTYGDGVSDVDINRLRNFHLEHGRLLTLTAVIPEGRFGQLRVAENNSVNSFKEKPPGEGWINGGFFVCHKSVIDYIAGDTTVFEKEPMQQLAEQGELMAYKHEGFWKCMDTLRDKKELEQLWQSGEVPWKTWN